MSSSSSAADGTSPRIVDRRAADTRGVGGGKGARTRDVVGGGIGGDRTDDGGGAFGRARPSIGATSSVDSSRSLPTKRREGERRGRSNAMQGSSRPPQHASYHMSHM